MYRCVLAAAVAATAAALPRRAEEAPAATCAFTTDPAERKLDGGIRSWIWTEPYAAYLFEDGLKEGGEQYDEYTAWLNETIPRDFGGLDPFDQRGCLKHQREIFAAPPPNGPGQNTHDWDVILNGSVGELSAINCVESLLWGVQNKYLLRAESTQSINLPLLRGPFLCPIYCPE